MSELLVELQEGSHLFDKLVLALRKSLGVVEAHQVTEPTDAEDTYLHSRTALRDAANVTKDFEHLFAGAADIHDGINDAGSTISKPSTLSKNNTAIATELNFPEVFGRKLDHNIFADLIQTIPALPHVSLLTYEPKPTFRDILDMGSLGETMLCK
jgi:fumarate hydratase class II